jgi:hypothetical protein
VRFKFELSFVALQRDFVKKALDIEQICKADVFALPLCQGFQNSASFCFYFSYFSDNDHFI